jgi:hypothetical protein
MSPARPVAASAPTLTRASRNTSTGETAGEDRYHLTRPRLVR